MKGLSITLQGKRVLMHCHSCGATLPEILRVLDSSNGDAPRVTVRGKEPVTRVRNDAGTRGMQWWVEKTGVAQDVWERLGCEEDGSGVRFTFEGHDAYKVRKPPKEMRWANTTDAEAPPFWPAPEDEMPEEISITEGESDCGTAHAAGLPYAYSVTKGAKSALPSGWARSLANRGVQKITVIGDMDDSGEQFMARLAREATAAGLTAEVVRLENILDPFSGLNDLNGVWRACESTEQFHELIERATERVANRIPFRTVDEMEEQAKKEIEWLVPDLIAPGDKIMLAAPQKSLKSWLALELTRSLVTQTPFLKRVEWVPARRVRVGYIQEEGAQALWARRIHMLRITGNEDAIFAHRTGFRFNDPSMVDEIIASARDFNLDLLIFDPMQRMVPGIDMNSDTDTGIIWDEVMRIQMALPHVCCMIVHHANKTDRLTWDSIRGSSRHAGEVDLGLFIERHPIEDQTLRMWLDGRDIPQYLGTGESFEVKYVIDREQRLFEMDATEISISIANPQIKGKANRENVFQAVKGGCNTRTKIMRETNLSDATVIEHLRTLTEDNLVEEIDNGPGKAKTYKTKTEERESDNATDETTED